jgi:hypothetical protein
MRLLARGVLPLLVFAAIVFAHADDPAPPKLAVPNVFSYQLPPGWTRVDLPGTTYPSAVEGPASPSVQPNTPSPIKAMISINTDIAQMPLTEWCSKSLDKNRAQFAELKAQVGELELFHTNNPVTTGFRATVDLAARGRQIHYVMYFFAGGGDTKIAVTCACPASDADHYAPLFEGAMKTFVPY